MPEIEILEADLSDPVHQEAIITLLDAYARNPLIRGHPLCEDVRRKLIPGLRQQPGTVLFLARRGYQHIGIAVCFQGFSTFAARPLLNIHDIAVLTGFRGQGVGRRLLNAVERKARELDCCKLTLEVLENNSVARGLYESVGFTAGEDGSASRKFLFLAKHLESEGAHGTQPP